MAPGSGGGLSNNDSTSTAPQLCSGRGRCECGQCRCADTFYGTFCESSATHGSNALCSFYEPCVACLLERQPEATASPATAASTNGHSEPPCRPQCTGSDGIAFRVSWVNTPEAGDERTYAVDDGPPSAAVCVLRLSSNTDSAGGAAAAAGHVCEHRFGYRVADEPQQQRLSYLRIVRQECSAPVGAAVLGASILVATFLVGFMVLMAVKMVHMVQDRREFARFEAEVRQTKYEEFTSPLYRSPTRVYEVPARVRNSAGGGVGISEFEMNGL